MIANIEPYPAMKDSGVRWLGEVPEHWETTAVKRNFTIQLGKMLQNQPHGPNDIEVPYLKAQHVQWFAVRTSGLPKMWASPRDLEQYAVAVGDLLVCEGGEGGRSGIVREIRPGYIIQNALHRVRPFGRCLNEFLQYVMSAVAVAGWFDAINDKATIAHLIREKFGALELPVPPLHEQAAIVHFLNHADLRIRYYIHAKQRLIKLLEEQKQAIIHRAVTRGLEPDVQLKPSGVEWLGNVPEQWRIIQIRHFARVGNGSTPSRGRADYWSEGTFPWLNSSVVNQAIVNESDQFVTQTALHECHLPILNPGSVLVAITGQGKTRGKAALLNTKATINQHLAYIAIRGEGVGPTFLQNVLTAAYTTLRSISDASGSTKSALTCADLRHFKVPVPPVTEQIDVVNWIKQQNLRSNRVIDHARHEISLFREYRTRLIADVVTGKLDVREAAACLPDESEEPSPLDETAPLPDGVLEPTADPGTVLNEAEV